MPRLGELLVAEGLLSDEQVQAALRAQVMWGGRLGTNLVELGSLDLDALSGALGRQHLRPAALARHFQHVNPELQRMLTPAFADRYSCVPLCKVDGGNVVVAVAGPLDARGVGIIAEELAVEPSQVIQACAAELRIRYHLERVYDIPRGARFLRARGPTVTSFLYANEAPEHVDSTPDLAIPEIDDAGAAATGLTPPVQTQPVYVPALRASTHSTPPLTVPVATPVDPQAATRAIADARAAAAAKALAEARSDVSRARAKAEAEADAKWQARVAADADAQADARAKAKAELDARAKAQAVVDARAKAEAAKADAAAKAKAEAAAKATAEAEAKAKVAAEAQLRADLHAQAEADAIAQAEADADAAPLSIESESDNRSDHTMPLPLPRPPRMPERPPYPQRARDASLDGPTQPMPPIAHELDELSGRTARPEAPPAEDAGGRDRRRYVRTLADLAETTPPPGAGPDNKTLGRIAIRRVAVGADGHVAPAIPAIPAIPPPPPPPSAESHTLADATRAIRRAQDRDRVAELAMEAIDRFAPTCDAAMMLVVRGEVAIGWKGFVRDEPPPPELAVHFEDRSLVTLARKNRTARCAAADLEPIDRLLLEAFGKADGDLVVLPVAIAGQVPCMIAIATATDAPVTVVEAVAAAAGVAFARLMRDATR